MSVDNLPMNNFPSQQYNKPSLSIMLPDPIKYSLQAGATKVNNNNGSFTLPPIRELLKSTSPQPQVQTQATTPAASVQQQQKMSSPPQQPLLYQPQPTIYQSPFSNPISPIANTPEQQLRSQPPNMIPRSNSLQSYYSHQPPQFQQQYQHPHFYSQQQHHQIPNGHLSPPSSVSLDSTRSSSTSPINSDSKEKLNSRKKRQNLPRQTTLILLSWLSEHLDRPYPNSREKYELLMKTRLTIQQLDNWFINARRRKINILRKLKENDQNIALTF